MKPMTHPIEAILFDIGGTLRGSIPAGEATKLEKVRQILDMLGAGDSPEEFAVLLSQRWQAYLRWARETLMELDEPAIWSRWLLPDRPAGQVTELSVQLHRLWREATGTREIFPETREVVLELFRRGYRLGIVSNTTSSTEVPHTLRELQLTGCFETVVLSCQLGIRKPDPAILLEAVRRMDIPPARCAYIGDRLDRDAQSAQRAGFAEVVIRRDADFSAHQARHPGITADHYVDDLRALLEIFPGRQGENHSRPLFHASLSTMWARKNFPGLSDFLLAAKRLGMASVELNHQLSSASFNGTNLSHHSFSSLHEPCPADVSTEELKQRDWLISSPAEERRRRGVQSIQRSIDFAARWAIPVIVVHSGMVSIDISLEKQLDALLEAGLDGTDEYRRLQQEMVQYRLSRIAPCFEAVKNSLRELLEYARPHGIRLGLENRYHYFDIPTLDEMSELLELAPPRQLGFVYDVGHAQAMDRRGFFPHEEWLRRYASRIIEVHLHDVRGVHDHLAPGRGEVDFDMVASYLPEGAIRTLELLPSNTPEQVTAGLRVLSEHGCLHIVKEGSYANQSPTTPE